MGISSLPTLEKFCKECISSQTKMEILDLGCGTEQTNANYMIQKCLNVSTLDIVGTPNYLGDFNWYVENDILTNKFDAVWCSHVLEHQENVGKFLRGLYSVVKDDGIICITVPPAHESLLGGHLSLWNLSQLYYNMIVAGLDCSKARHFQYAGNISVIVRKKMINPYPKLVYDNGDIETLSRYFPYKVIQGMNGSANIENTF